MKKLKLLIVLYMAFVMCLGFGITTTAYFDSNISNYVFADTEPSDPNAVTYNVDFYISGVFYKRYRLNQNQSITKPTDFCDDAESFNWNYKGTSNAFDFTNTKIGTSSINLELAIPSTDAVVLFMKENPSYQAGTGDILTSSQYIVSFISYVTKGGTIAEPSSSKNPEKTGYDFKYWGTSATSISSFDFANQQINATVTLYPNYSIKTFTVQFLVEGTIHNTQTISYNNTVATVPTPTAEGKVFSHWYVQGDVNKTPFDISTHITQNYTLVAEFTSAQLSVTVNNFIYGDIVEEDGTIIEDMPNAINGGNYVFFIQLNENYNNYALKNSNLNIQGTRTSYNVSQVQDQKGKYKVTIYGVATDLTISIINVTINQYTVKLSYTLGLDISVLESVDYTMSGNDYILDFGVEFAFEVAVNSNYELTGAQILVSNCTYDDVRDCYVLNTTKQDQTITINAELKECVNIIITGIDNLNITIENSTYIVKTLDDGTYRVQKGQFFTFSATTLGSYYIKSYTNATLSNSIYRVNADVAKEVNFNVVDTTYFSIYMSTVGISNIDVTNHLGVTYSSATKQNIYRVEIGSDLIITFTRETAYSNAILNLSTTTSNEIDMTNYPQVVVKNIVAEGELIIEPPQKNTYVATLTSNAMVTLSAGNNIATHGESLVVNITKTAPYTYATITSDNVTILGSFSGGYTIAEDYSTITINGITSEITVTIDGLSKNRYSVLLMSSDEYGSITATSGQVEYGNSFTFLVNLRPAYSKTTITKDIINIVASSSGAPRDYNMIINNNTVVIENVVESLTISLNDLTLNTYTMHLPNNIDGQYEVFSQNTTISYNGTFTFTITLSDAYSKNAQTMTVVKKIGSESVTVEPVIEDNVLTYTIENVVSDLTFQVSTLKLNVYTIEFYDTDPEELSTTRKVEHGQVLRDIPTITKEGNSFINWSYDKTGTSPVNFNNAIYEDFICYAIFSTRTFTVTFVDFQGSREVIVNYGKACPLPEIRPKEGWDNAHWDLTGIAINAVKQDYTVNAIYIQNVYTVIFKNGDTIHNKQEVLHGESAQTPENPTRRGYTFRAWDRAYSNVTSDLTINALFDVIAYRVSFYNANKENTLILSFDVNFGEKVLEPQQSPTNRSEYIFNYIDIGSGELRSPSKVLEEGYVLEGWYSDEDLSLKYNFDEPVTGNLDIYGNMQLTKILIKFYVDGEFYTEKAVDYKGTLTSIPSVPHKVGYDQVAPVWEIEGTKTDFTNLTNDLVVNAVYRINTYVVKFVFPGGTETYTRNVTHGASVANIPLPATKFGEIIIYNKDATRYVTKDQTIYITVFNIIPYLIAIGGTAALVLVVVSLAITITTIKKNKQDMKKMEQLIKDIREQDKRLTQINEQKLKAQVDAEMKRKEKINKNKFLE